MNVLKSVGARSARRRLAEHLFEALWRGRRADGDVPGSEDAALQMNESLREQSSFMSEDQSNVTSLASDNAMERRLVFVHLPKTGGTALRAKIVSLFADALVCPEAFDLLDRYDRDALKNFTLFCGHYNFESVLRIPGDLYIFTCLRDPQARILSLYYFWRRHKPEYIEEHDLAGPRLARSLGLLDFLRRGHETGAQNAMTRQLAGAVVPTSEPGVYRAVPLAGSGEPNRALSADEVLARALENAARLDAVGVMDRLDELYDEVARATGLPVRAGPLPRVNARDQSWPHLDDRVEEEPITNEIQAELDRLTDLDRVVYQELCRRLPER